MKKRIIAILTCLVIIISVVYFAPDSDAGVQTLNLTSQSKTITVGQSFQCKLDGLKASKVKWSSSNKKVATVNKKGVVKGVSSGKASIMGKYKGIKFTIKVSVSGNSKTLIYKDTIVEYLGAKKVKYNSWGDKELCYKISFKFTNNSSTPKCFEDYYSYDAFVNNVSCDANYYDEDFTMVKNGASIIVDYYFTIKGSPTIEFSLTRDDNFKTVFVRTYNP